MTSNTAADSLRNHIEAIEKMEEEIRDMRSDVSERYKWAKAEGYDVKCMKQIVAIRRMRPDDRHEMENIVDTYKAALGID